MYAEDLEEKRIPLTSLYLDPNNPRFEDLRTKIPDKRIVEPEVQAKAYTRLKRRWGIRNLVDSILWNGFLPLDRIVVVPIRGKRGKYVVVEGNRRLAALKTITDDIRAGKVEGDGFTPDYLQSLAKSIRQITCLVYTGNDKDIAWILQGIRHLSGIWDWEPEQKAELVAKEIDERGLDFGAVGQMLGMSSIRVGKYYRAFKALQQMRSDPEFGEHADKRYFTLFDEAYSKTAIRAWLGWDEAKKAFTNAEHVSQFYSWITPNPDPDHKNVRRIHDPRNMSVLNRIISTGNFSLLQRLDDYEVTIDQAEFELKAGMAAGNWLNLLSQAKNAVERIPLVALIGSPQLAEQLRDLETTLHKLVRRVTAASRDPARRRPSRQRDRR